MGDVVFVMSYVDLEESHIVLEFLRQNYGKCDSRVVCNDGSYFIVAIDDLVGVVDGFIVIRDKYEFMEDCTVVPSIVKCVNLDCVKSVECVDGDMFGFDDLVLK